VSHSRRDRYRILVGTVEVGGTLTDFADGFRRLGHSVTSVIRQTNRFYPDSQYDVDISVSAPDIVPWPQSIARSRSLAVRLPRGAANRLASWSQWLALMLQHDIFVFQWGGTSLTDGNREYPFLKRLNKRIVSVFNGSDIRYPPAHLQQFSGLPTNAEYQKALLARTSDDPVGPVRNLRIAELHSDLILSVPNQSSMSVRPYMHFLVPIDLSKYACHIPESDVPVIVHAPSSRALKGTDAILAALDTLRADGIPFELRLMDRFTNQEVIAELAKADIAIDQLYAPCYGKFGLEAMASGCALATCSREDYEPFPSGRPIWHVDASNILEKLRLLLTNKDLRIRLAREGRSYVERYHAHVAVASRILASLDGGEIHPYDHYPTFCAVDYRPDDISSIPEVLKEMTLQVVRRHGLPPEANPREMISRGLLSQGSPRELDEIPRWKISRAAVETRSEFFGAPGAKPA